MPAIIQPPKHLVREYLQRRARDPKPPPSPEEIRRELGWGLRLPGFKLVPSRALPHAVLQELCTLSYFF